VLTFAGVSLIGGIGSVDGPEVRVGGVTVGDDADTDGRLLPGMHVLSVDNQSYVEHISLLLPT
jgi:hypothetical protein